MCRPMFKNYVLIVISTIILFSCVEEYWPELESKDEKLLVVEGFISNTAGPYIIKLSKSRSLDSIPNSTRSKYDYDAYEDAVVSIIDDQNNVEALTEIEPGIYQTSDEIQGVVGRKYKLKIEGENGKTYESDFDELKSPIGILSINYTEFTSEHKDNGILFNVTTENTPDISYFKWDLEETYEYHSPYIPTHYFNGFFQDGFIDFNGNIHTGNMSYTVPYNLKPLDYNIDSILYCWQTQTINEQYIHTNRFSEGIAIANFPLNFIPHGDIRIRIRYSLLVKQHVISELAYDFIKQVVEQNSHNEDDLYTKQPFQIRGNIKNINNPEEPVLGIFYARSTTEKRIFTPPDNQPKNENTFKVEYCKNIPTVSYSPISGAPSNDIIPFLSDQAQNKANLWPIYLGWAIVYDPRTTNPDQYPEWFVGFAKSCIDCRRRGGVNEMPPYWNYD